MDLGTVWLAQNQAQPFLTTTDWSELVLVCSFGASDVYVSEKEPRASGDRGMLLPASGTVRLLVPPDTTLWAVCTTAAGTAMGYAAVELSGSPRGVS